MASVSVLPVLKQIPVRTSGALRVISRIALYNVRYDQSANLGLSDLPFPSAKANEAPREHITLPAVALISSPFLSMRSREDACDGCARSQNRALIYRGAAFSRLQFHRVTVRPFSCNTCGHAEPMFPKPITELSLIRQHPGDSGQCSQCSLSHWHERPEKPPPRPTNTSFWHSFSLVPIHNEPFIADA